MDTTRQFAPYEQPMSAPLSIDLSSFPGSYVPQQTDAKRAGFFPRPKKRTRTTIEPPEQDNPMANDFSMELNVTPLLGIKPLDPSSIPLGPSIPNKKESEEAKYELRLEERRESQSCSPPAATRDRGTTKEELQEKMVEAEDSPDSSPKRSPGESESESGADRKSKQERNRESARKCRRRKKEYLVNLENDMNAMKEQLAACKAELEHVKAQLLTSALYQELEQTKNKAFAQVKSMLESEQTAAGLPDALRFIDVTTWRKSRLDEVWSAV